MIPKRPGNSVMQLGAPLFRRLSDEQLQTIHYASLEIAERLGVSVGTVKIRLHRGRGMLRKAMETRCDLYRDSRLGLACDAKAGS